VRLLDLVLRITLCFESTDIEIATQLPRVYTEHIILSTRDLLTPKVIYLNNITYFGIKEPDSCVLRINGMGQERCRNVRSGGFI